MALLAQVEEGRSQAAAARPARKKFWGLAAALVLIVGGTSWYLSSRSPEPEVSVPSGPPPVVAQAPEVGSDASTVAETPPSPPSPPPTTPPAPAAVAEPGILVIDALPWGRVTRVVDADGRAVPTADETYTPLHLSVPPGSYTVVLTHPKLARPREIAVEVSAQATTRRVVELVAVDVAAYFERAGW